jgi:hypothetical protein
MSYIVRYAQISASKHPEVNETHHTWYNDIKKTAVYKMLSKSVKGPKRYTQLHLCLYEKYAL